MRPDPETFLAMYAAYIEQVEAKLAAAGRPTLGSLARLPVDLGAEMRDAARDKALEALEVADDVPLERLTRTGEPGEPQADEVDALMGWTPWDLLGSAPVANETALGE